MIFDEVIWTEDFITTGTLVMYVDTLSNTGGTVTMSTSGHQRITEVAHTNRTHKIVIDGRPLK